MSLIGGLIIGSMLSKKNHSYRYETLVPRTLEEEQRIFFTTLYFIIFTKLLKLYPIEFEEFVINNGNVPLQSTSNEQSSKISDLENQVVDLQSQLEVANQSLSKKDKTDAQVMAARDVIVQLRISNGEGKDPSQFSDQFPYELKT